MHFIAPLLHSDCCRRPAGNQQGHTPSPLDEDVVGLECNKGTIKCNKDAIKGNKVQ